MELENEIGQVILSFPPAQQAVAIKWQDWIVGFVQPASVNIDEPSRLKIQRLNLSVIPDRGLALRHSPMIVNGKTARSALETRLEETTAAGDDIMSLARNNNSTSIYDALRMSFLIFLHVNSNEHNKDSSS
jgi:hypothetical protein